MLFRKVDKRRFKGIFTNEVPEEIKDNIVYVVGEKSFKWLGIFRCPCGCQEIIQLNLLDGGVSVWKVVIHRNRFATIKPSVWRTTGCKSHFTIKRGYLNWVSDYSDFNDF